jgi:chromate reductase
MYDVAVFVGSLRRDSFSRKVALALADLAPDALKLRLVEIGHLPFYNPDDEGLPAWTAFREQVRAADAFLFVTPEYNRGLPAVLKNAIDVGSRPYGANAWAGRPGGVVSVTPGHLGAFGANHHLRQSLVCLDVAAMPAPEAYLSGAGGYFDTEGRLVKEDTRAFLVKFITSFEAWVAKQRG